MPLENEKLWYDSTESEVTLKPSSSDNDTVPPSVGACQSDDTRESDAFEQAASTSDCQPAAVSAALRRLFPLDALDEARATREGKRRSAAIDEYLKEEGVKMRRDHKIIILGPGRLDVLFHRVARVANEPLTDKEREESIPSIRRKLFYCMQTWLYAVIAEFDKPRQLAPEPNAAAEAVVKTIDNTLSSHRDGQQAATIEALLELLQDPELEGHLRHRNVNPEEIADRYVNSYEFTAGNCSCSFDSSIPQHLMRVFASDYVPTDHDWCHFGQEKIGIHVEEVKFDRGGHKLGFLRVGRVGGERKKWIHLFDNCAVVASVIDLACYDTPLFEDESTTVMNEALALFDSVCHSRRFTNASQLVVLFNAAKFRSKMATSPSRFGKIFPKFRGGDADGAIDFISNRFKDVARERPNVYTYVSDFLDPALFGDIIDFIERRVLTSPKPSSKKSKEAQ